MTQERWVPRDAGKLFRSIVVVGGSLALGCGGKTDVPDDEEETGSDGSGGAWSAGGSASGGATSGGAASGGAASGGATSGGATSGGAASGGGDGDCPPEQWDCSDVNLYSFYGDGSAELYCTYLLPEGCTCDPTRPTEPEDCPSGTARTCLAAGSTSEGELTELQPFACSCVSFDPDAQYCTEACSVLGYPRVGSTALCDEDQPYINILCGCELPILR